MTTIKQLKKFAENSVDFGNNNLQKFTERFAQNPAYAFEWSQDAFRAAASISVGKTLLAWIEVHEAKAEQDDESFINDTEKEVARTVQRAARWPERSTSQQSNLMKQEIASVWAELQEKFTGTL